MLRRANVEILCLVCSVVVECEFWNRFPKAEIRRKTGHV